MANRQWYRGAELPSLSIWWTDSESNLLDLSTADSFELRAFKAGCPPAITKTSGLVGAVGSGTEASGVPNLSVQWATGELAIDPGIYTVVITATFGELDRKMSTSITILDDGDTDS